MPESTKEKSVRTRTKIGQIVEGFGGEVAWAARLDQHERLAARMKGDIAALPELDGDLWAAMGRDEVLETANSLEEVLSILEAKGMADGTVVVKLLNAKPEVMVL